MCDLEVRAMLGDLEVRAMLSDLEVRAMLGNLEVRAMPQDGGPGEPQEGSGKPKIGGF